MQVMGGPAGLLGHTAIVCREVGVDQLPAVEGRELQLRNLKREGSAPKWLKWAPVRSFVFL